MANKKRLITEQEKTYLESNWGKLSIRQISRNLGMPFTTLHRFATQLGLKKVEPDVVEKFREDRSKKQDTQNTKKALHGLVEKNDLLQKEIDVLKRMSKNAVYGQITVKDTGKDEAVAVALASDWHIEEVVIRASVNGLNEHNLKIAERRANEFFINLVKLIKKEQKDTVIKTLVLWLGGDFITGNIHEENLETACLTPIEAILTAQVWLERGIQYVLDNTDLNLVIPTSAGNHSRITKKVHISTEYGNSLETYMYHMIAQHIDNKRVQFVIDESYFTYVTVYDMTLCFHHGHALRYQGGVGGLYVPARRALGQWNKKRKVDIWAFGHFHSYIQDPAFLCNGSNIGWNAYADRLSVDFDAPKQTFFLIDKKRKCRTVTIPIVYSI